MDPATNSFTPQSEIWRLSTAMKSFQDTQQEHAERLSRVERRQDEEAKVKSVWGPSSPFPGVLSGTSQQSTRPQSRFFPPGSDSPSTAPANQSAAADFANFDDDHSNNMIRSLHLDADDEPRRMGATSRANSVRFDESATQGQLAHASRPSVDLNSRTSSTLGGLGGLPMFERSSSHKSDGRHSSAGQSAISGRANSLGLDTANQLPRTPSEQPGLTPGLLLLGTVPSIIRCWLNNDFSHESMLYAAVCTGSYKSVLDARIVRSLDLLGQIRQDINGDNRIKLPMYLPEAVLHPSSSQSSSPTQQLPSLTVDFTVVDHGEGAVPTHGIQIIIGSDTLRIHRADISFVSNSMTAFDDDSSKLTIPLVRPEDESTFKTLCTINLNPKSSRVRSQSDAANTTLTSKPGSPALPNGIRNVEERVPLNEHDSSSMAERNQSPPSARRVSQAQMVQHGTRRDSIEGENHDRKPSLGPLSISKSSENKDAAEPSPSTSSSARTSSSPAIWSNWRREGSISQPSQSDWANVSRGSSANYAPPNRDQGIKVLKPTRHVSRSSNVPQSASPTVTGQSRLFDEGKKRNGLGSSAPSGPGSDSGDSGSNLRRTASLENNSSKSGTKESNTAPPASKTPRSANPIGGASAFGWLNSGQDK